MQLASPPPLSFLTPLSYHMKSGCRIPPPPPQARDFNPSPPSALLSALPGHAAPPCPGLRGVDTPTGHPSSAATAPLGTRGSGAFPAVPASEAQADLTPLPASFRRKTEKFLSHSGMYPPEVPPVPGKSSQKTPRPPVVNTRPQVNCLKGQVSDLDHDQRGRVPTNGAEPARSWFGCCCCFAVPYLCPHRKRGGV